MPAEELAALQKAVAEATRLSQALVVDVRAPSGVVLTSLDTHDEEIRAQIPPCEDLQHMDVMPGCCPFSKASTIFKA